MKRKTLAFTGAMALLVVLAFSREARGQQFETGGYFLNLSTLTVDSYGEEEDDSSFCELWLEAHGEVSLSLSAAGSDDAPSEARITNVWYWTGAVGTAPESEIDTDMSGSGSVETWIGDDECGAYVDCIIDAQDPSGSLFFASSVVIADANLEQFSISLDTGTTEGEYGGGDFDINYSNAYPISAGTGTIACYCDIYCHAYALSDGAGAYAYVSLENGAYCDITLLY